MENETLLKEVTAKAQTWLGDGYDEATKAEVRRMLDNDDKTELIESFYKDLEFGTGGLRGIMGAGTNRMNNIIQSKIFFGRRGSRWCFSSF